METQAVNQPTIRTAADDDGGDSIGYETPRSGVATPQPDLQDKRLPGIMSYFGQVRRQHSLVTSVAESTCRSQSNHNNNSTSMADAPRHSDSAPGLQSQPHDTQDSVSCGNAAPKADLISSLARETSGLSLKPSGAETKQDFTHSYPTPPTSQPSSSGNSLRRETRTSGSQRANSSEKNSEVPTRSSVRPHSTSSKPTSSFSTSSRPSASQSSGKWYSLDGLKELTRGVMFKSGPPTPTRALSAAQPSHAEPKIRSSRSSNEGAEKSGTQTPRGSASATGAQVPVPKGKLTIKVAEARGLKKSREPYIVVVFQRSELISGGPRQGGEDETLSVTPTNLTSISIQRQNSDSGRPAVSIPMRSRQSSNTSITDYNTFRNRAGRMSSFTHPTWDAEAEL